MGIQNIYSSVPDLSQKVLFSNTPRKLNSFDKRVTCVIESTDGSVVHVIISGAMFHMWKEHLYSLKLPAASPQRDRADRACSCTKKQKGDKEEKPYREKLISTNVLPPGLSQRQAVFQEQHFIECLSH